MIPDTTVDDLCFIGSQSDGFVEPEQVTSKYLTIDGRILLVDHSSLEFIGNCAYSQVSTDLIAFESEIDMCIAD